MSILMFSPVQIIMGDPLVIRKNRIYIKPALFSANTELTLKHVVQRLLYGCSVELYGSNCLCCDILSIRLLTNRFGLSSDIADIDLYVLLKYQFGKK